MGSDKYPSPSKRYFRRRTLIPKSCFPASSRTRSPSLRSIARIPASTPYSTMPSVWVKSNKSIAPSSLSRFSAERGSLGNLSLLPSLRYGSTNALMLKSCSETTSPRAPSSSQRAPSISFSTMPRMAHSTELIIAADIDPSNSIFFTLMLGLHPLMVEDTGPSTEKSGDENTSVVDIALSFVSICPRPPLDSGAMSGGSYV
mmetsp:Transcript_3538/g.8133  ORF Transcript_3538/g.8133 Transcript_3538/m.8133 type:complete len:201 (+) Transcript_3538:2735-3337(+)